MGKTENLYDDVKTAIRKVSTGASLVQNTESTISGIPERVCLALHRAVKTAAGEKQPHQKYEQMLS